MPRCDTARDTPMTPTDRRLYYSGFLLASLGYGMHLILSITIVAVLSRRRYRSSLGRRLALPFSILMVICSTLTWSVDAWHVEQSLVETGPDTSLHPSYECASEVVASVLHTLPLLMSDALLLYRAWIILDRRTPFFIVPSALYVACFGVALAVISRDSNRKALGYVLAFGPGDSLPIVFFSLTIALNLYLTSAIIFKLWMARRNLIAVGPLLVAQAQPYMTIIGIFLESALPYSASGIFYICTIMSKSSIQFISGRLFFVSSFLCPAFIVIRIAFGVSYTPPDETTAPLDTHHDWVYHVEQEVRVDPALSPAMITKRRDRRAGRGVSLNLVPVTTQSHDQTSSIELDREALGSVEGGGIYDSKQMTVNASVQGHAS